MRNMIIRTAMFAAYLVVFLVTVSFALSGYSSGPGIALAVGVTVDAGNFQMFQLIGLVVGLVIGFIIGSFAAAALFLLREISESSRAVALAVSGQDAREGGYR